MLKNLKPNSEAVLKIVLASAVVHLLYLVVCSVADISPNINLFWTLTAIGWSIAVVFEIIMQLKKEFWG